jgi:hypothetical protein
MTKINFVRMRFWLFIALIIGMPLSKYPSVALPAFDFPSYRLGLYQVLAGIFVLLCAWPAILKTRELFKQNKTAFISLVVLAVVVIAGLFSAINKSRSALLAVSILFLLALVATGWWYVRHELKASSYPLILRCILYAGIIYGVLGIGQFIAGTFTASTLGIACPGCTSEIFGFPRVNLFSAEPLFFANALLPFFFASLAVFYKKTSRLALGSLILTSLAIGLTFSRGAYGAVVAGLMAFAVFVALGKNLKIKRFASIVGLVVACWLASLGLMIASASWHYRDTPNITYDTTSTILEHVSLGLVSLPAKVLVAEEVPVVTPTVAPEQTTTLANATESFVSPGLIEASTSDRLGAADLALQAWRSNYSTIAIGVGAGNLGPFAVKNIDPSLPNNLTVYIFYVLVLAELGLAGLLAFTVLHLNAIWRLLKRRNNNDFLLYATSTAILIAFLAQYFFFGTYINTIYVWLFAGIALGLDRRST